ncbi:ribosomal L7Ae/L30e/S12e/Gadd45 family protein [Candidatus Woesearchaeota archaeon]|nr:ribosomal L7Ae/L30e/S12e/Gadd45 family protein [Candidatus Woesearchaeota archaeon]
MTTLDQALKGKKVVFGAERTMKLLKKDKLKVVFLANNTKEELKEDFQYYAKIGNVEVVELDMKNKEVGTYCKKPFSVSVVGLEK